MMVRYHACSVKGCEDKQSTRHTFPNVHKVGERFNEWIAACGNDELLLWEPSYILKNRRVCHVHFDIKHVIQNNRLTVNAGPTLHLPLQINDNVDTSSAPSGCGDFAFEPNLVKNVYTLLTNLLRYCF